MNLLEILESKSRNTSVILAIFYLYYLSACVVLLSVQIVLVE